MKSYIIMEKGFEYDDNTYNPTDGGNPRKVFFSRKDAETDLEILEIKNIKQIDISHYMPYDFDEGLNVDIDEFKNYLKSLNDKYGLPEKKYSWDNNEYVLNPKATDEETIKFLNMFSLRFFEIVEVDVDLPSFRNQQISEILS